MNQGFTGGYWTETKKRAGTPTNRNCFFVIQSGSMCASGRTELLGVLFGKLYNMDGADSADVYANNDGRIHYLGNIKSSYPYGQDLWSIPYGGGEGWTNIKTLAGFIETYNHTFIFDDSDSMPELLQSVYEVVDESKEHDFTGILIKNDEQVDYVAKEMERANQKGIDLVAFTPQMHYGFKILNEKMDWLARNRD